MTPKIVHFAPWGTLYTSCGLFLTSALALTPFRAETTCLRCLRTFLAHPPRA